MSGENEEKKPSGSEEKKPSGNGITKDMWLVAVACLVIAAVLLLPGLLNPGTQEASGPVPQETYVLDDIRAIDEQRYVISHTNDDGSHVFDTVWSDDVEIVVDEGGSVIEYYGPGEAEDDTPLYKVKMSETEYKNLEESGESRPRHAG